MGPRDCWLIAIPNDSIGVPVEAHRVVTVPSLEPQLPDITESL
jgi:hypothetical protein